MQAGMQLKMKQLFKQTLPRLFGLCIIFALAACGMREPSPTAPGPDSVPTSRSTSPSLKSEESLPQICNCLLRFEHISIEQGLSQSSVRVIFQDSRGFLWFGTEDGLNRYDGYTFKTFKPEPSNPNSLSDGWITDIVEDQNGYLWIGTRLGGLNHYDPFTGQFIQYQHLDDQPNTLNDKHISALLVDRDATVFVGLERGIGVEARRPLVDV